MAGDGQEYFSRRKFAGVSDHGDMARYRNATIKYVQLL